MSFVLDRTAFAAWLDAQPEATRAWLQAQQFKAAAGTHALLPGEDGVAGAVLGIGDPLDAYSYAHGPMALPEGDWTPAGELPAAQAAALQLGWGLGAAGASVAGAPQAETTIMTTIAKNRNLRIVFFSLKM